MVRDREQSRERRKRRKGTKSNSRARRTARSFLRNLVQNQPLLTLGYEGSVPSMYRLDFVWNQNRNLTCISCAFAQMFTVYFRMKDWERNQSVVLSRKPLETFRKVEQVNSFMTTRMLGLYDEASVVGRRRFTLNWPVDSIRGYCNKVEALVRNFGPGGQMLPMVGVCTMGDLNCKELAKKTTKEMPYGLESETRYPLPGDHAVLILGIYVLSSHPLKLSVYIKNSWGRQWGKKGYAWVLVDFFDFVAGFNPLEFES